MATAQTLNQRIRSHRWNWRRLFWWKPLIERHRLASGPYGGWHCWWGPFHIWNVVTHHGVRERGWGWR